MVDPLGLSALCRIVVTCASTVAGAMSGAQAGCEAGSIIGGTGGTLVEPGGGTLVGGAGGCAVGGLVGGVAGAVSGNEAGSKVADAVCSDNGNNEENECKKASKFHLKAAGITDEHDFKREYVGGSLSRYDICACKDGTIKIKQVGQCGKPGPSKTRDTH